MWVPYGTLEPEESHVTNTRHFAFLLVTTNAVSPNTSLVPTRWLVDKPAFDAPTVGIRNWQQSASHLSQAQLRRGSQDFDAKQSIFCFGSSCPICRLPEVRCVLTLKDMLTENTDRRARFVNPPFVGLRHAATFGNKSFKRFRFRAEDDDGDIPPRQILLVFPTLVHGHQNIEMGQLHGLQKIAVF